MHDDDAFPGYERGLFERPVVEWTDGELSAGLAVLGQEIALAGEGRAQRLTELAGALADERDRRAPLYRSAEDALCPVTAGPARILRTSSERRRDRRRG